MNKKGFTLTELLATIVILSVVVTIAVPAVIGVSNLIKNNMYESKKKLILQAAKLYGEDNTNKGSVTISTLCTDKYLTKDDNAASNTECVLNPKNNRSMGACIITFTRTNGRVKTTWTNNSPNCK